MPTATAEPGGSSVVGALPSCPGGSPTPQKIWGWNRSRGARLVLGGAQPPPARPPQGLLPALVAFFSLKSRNFQPGLGLESCGVVTNPQTSAGGDGGESPAPGPPQVPRAPLVLRAEPAPGRGAAPPALPVPPQAPLLHPTLAGSAPWPPQLSAEVFFLPLFSFPPPSRSSLCSQDRGGRHSRGRAGLAGTSRPPPSSTKQDPKGSKQP